MDNNLVTVIKDRIWRIIHQLQAQTFQSVDDIKHEVECVASILSTLSYEDDHIQICLHYIIQAVQTMDSFTVTSQYTHAQSCPTSAGSGLVGRPTFFIPVEYLEFLIDSGFKLKHISEMCGVSQRTISRRLAENDLSLSQKFSNISNEELDECVTEVLHHFPNIGYRSMKGHIHSKGHIIQEQRIRESMRRVDVEGVLLRQITAAPVRRRTYNVMAPNSLWHIDGYHKLIRWRFVIHGGIDGYSRMPVYLNISTNNRSETVLQYFLEGVATYGLPERVRSDKGGENVSVAEYMIENRGSNRGSHIAGRSVQNQRIEIFWRDLWTGCITVFYNLFYHMESIGVLDTDDEVQLQALHYIFLPRIQAHMDRFVASFTRRPLRTAGQQTPQQLWIQGQVYNQDVSLTTDGEFEQYGVVHVDGMYVAPDDFEAVVVPESFNYVSQEKMQELRNLVQPLSFSSVYGVDLFETALILL